MSMRLRHGVSASQAKPFQYWQFEEEEEKCIVINLMNDLNAGNLFECRVDNFQYKQV